jgi:hypothetical protein
MTVIEKHFQAKELVALLGWTRQRVSRRFKDHPRTVRDGRRFFVPQSVVEEVLEGLRNSKPTRRGRPRGSRNKPRQVEQFTPTHDAQYLAQKELRTKEGQ